MLKLPKYCILHYQSSDINNVNSFDFWFTGNLVRIISDKPFGRGDIAKIVSVKHETETEWCIYIEIIGSPNIDKIPDEVYADGEIPTLMFVTTKIYTNSYSDYKFFSDDNVDILLPCSAIKDDNKSYTVAILVKGSNGKIQAVDEKTGTEMEWIITDGAR